jgi:hypothetical protein
MLQLKYGSGVGEIVGTGVGVEVGGGVAVGTDVAVNSGVGIEMGTAGAHDPRVNTAKLVINHNRLILVSSGRSTPKIRK